MIIARSALAEPVRRLLDRLGRHAGDLAPRVAGPRPSTDSADLLEAGGVRVDEVAVLQSVAQDHVQHAHQQREVGAGPHAAGRGRRCG